MEEHCVEGATEGSCNGSHRMEAGATYQARPVDLPLYIVRQLQSLPAFPIQRQQYGHPRKFDAMSGLQ